MSRGKVAGFMNGAGTHFAESRAREPVLHARLDHQIWHMLPDPVAEVSGVCTWLEFRGQGLARRLMLHVVAELRPRGDRPYLHTSADNAGPIALYRQLGFRERRMMILTVMAPA